MLVLESGCRLGWGSSKAGLGKAMLHDKILSQAWILYPSKRELCYQQSDISTTITEHGAKFDL